MKNRPWIEAVALLILAAIPAVATNFLHPKRPAWNREILAKDEITLASAQQLTNHVWIDARSASAFEKGHIPGALLVNEDDWDRLLLPFAMQFNPNQNIIVYCDSLECNASHNVAERLRKELGAEKVFVLKGGWQTWTTQN